MEETQFNALKSIKQKKAAKKGIACLTVRAFTEEEDAILKKAVEYHEGNWYKSVYSIGCM